MWGCWVVIGVNNNSPLWLLLLLLLFIFYFCYLFVVAVVVNLFSLILLIHLLFIISLLLLFFKLLKPNLPIIWVLNPNFVCYKLANIFCVLYVFGKLLLWIFLLIVIFLLLLLALLSRTIEGLMNVTLCWCRYMSCLNFYSLGFFNLFWSINLFGLYDIFLLS